jgi:hypothetical protein
MRPRSPLPAAVVKLASEFDAWRRQRPSRRSRFPEDLLAKAAALARTHSIDVVARGTKLDRRSLRSALGRAPDSRPAARRRQAGPSVVRVAPLVVSTAAARLGGAAIEIENRAGEKLRLDPAVIDVQALIRAFLEDKR